MESFKNESLHKFCHLIRPKIEDNMIFTKFRLSNELWTIKFMGSLDLVKNLLDPNSILNLIKGL
jgi:hypothetical protein